MRKFYYGGPLTELHAGGLVIVSGNSVEVANLSEVALQRVLAAGAVEVESVKVVYSTSTRYDHNEVDPSVITRRPSRRRE